jgi:hypothetical protein
MAIGGANLGLSDVYPPYSYVADFKEIMGDALRSASTEEVIEVDLRKLRGKLHLDESQTLAVLDAADSYMLDRRWIPTGRKHVEETGLVRTRHQRRYRRSNRAM